MCNITPPSLPFSLNSNSVELVPFSFQEYHKIRIFEFYMYCILTQCICSTFGSIIAFFALYCIQLFSLLSFQDSFKHRTYQSVAMEPTVCNFDHQLIITACQWNFTLNVKEGRCVHCWGGFKRSARDRKIVEQSLRDMSTAPLSPDISNDFSDVHHSVIWTSLWVPRAAT